MSPGCLGVSHLGVSRCRHLSVTWVSGCQSPVLVTQVSPRCRVSRCWSPRCQVSGVQVLVTQVSGVGCPGVGHPGVRCRVSRCWSPRCQVSGVSHPGVGCQVSGVNTWVSPGEIPKSKLLYMVNVTWVSPVF